MPGIRRGLLAEEAGEDIADLVSAQTSEHSVGCPCSLVSEFQRPRPLVRALLQSEGPRSAQRHCGHSILRDGVAMLPLVAMIAGAQYADYSIDPYQRNEFDYKDGPSISFPLKPEIVTTTRLLLAAWIMPTLIIVTVTRFTNTRRHAFHALFGLTESAALSYTMVVIGKKCAGSLRPCFKAMCGWDENLQACMGDYFAIRDARQSFPSGHAGAAAAGLGFLALFLNRELCAWASRNRVPHSFVRYVWQCVWGWQYAEAHAGCIV